MWSRTAIAVAAVALATACSTTVTAAPSAGPHSGSLMAAAIMPYQATVIINGAHPGPVFQGIGAISGGGGNSRLLIDYPPRERAQILDYLFSPHFGASLQMLKLEIRSNGAWQIVASGPAAVTLASGSVTAARVYTLSLTTRGTTISAQINGVLVASVTNRMYRYGPAGLGSLGYYPVLYPSFTVR